MTEHEEWLKEQIVEAMDKAERGDSVYFSQYEAEKKMAEFKKSLTEKHNS